MRAPKRRAFQVSRSRPRCTLHSTAHFCRQLISPFTHILKPAGTAGFEDAASRRVALPGTWSRGGLQCAGRRTNRDARRHVAALIVERFEFVAVRGCCAGSLENFCWSSISQPPAKYDGTIEHIARRLTYLNNPTADLEVLFRRAVFAWLIADGDMHLKNLALLKIARPKAKSLPPGPILRRFRCHHNRGVPRPCR